MTAKEAQAKVNEQIARNEKIRKQLNFVAKVLIGAQVALIIALGVAAAIG